MPQVRNIHNSIKHMVYLRHTNNSINILSANIQSLRDFDNFLKEC